MHRNSDWAPAAKIVLVKFEKDYQLVSDLIIVTMIQNQFERFRTNRDTRSLKSDTKKIDTNAQFVVK